MHSDMPEEDIYDAVYHEDEQEIYDDLCSLKQKPTQVLRIEDVACCWKPAFFSRYQLKPVVVEC